MIATTTGDVWEGDGEPDKFGDEVDVPLTDTPTLADVPLSIIETTRQDRNPESSQESTLRTFAARVNPVYVIHDGARIRDKKTNRVYIVDGRTEVPSIAGRREVMLSLRAIE